MESDSSENILITNFHCASNRGDAAILEGLLATLDRTISQNQTVATEFPDASSYVNGATTVEQRSAPFRVDRPRRTGAYFMDLIGATRSKKIQSWVDSKLNLTPYRKADIIVGTGGHYLTEIYYPGKLGVLWELNYCKEIEKPVVLCGQSFGPVERTPYKQLTRRVLNKIDAITVRDRQSKRNLRSIGVKTDIFLTADAAFAMDLDTPAKPLTNRRVEKIPTLSGDPTITISVREWDHFDSGGMNQYLSGIVELCEHLVDEYGSQVYLLSTCTGFDGYHTDDRITAHKVHDRLSSEFESNVSIVTGEYTPQELIRLFEDADFHVGTRMHSLVLAILAGTPTVGIEYQFKTTGLMEMFKLEEYLLPIEQVDCNSLRDLFEKGYEEKKIIEKRIESNISDIRMQAERNGEIIANVIEKHY